MGQASDLVAGMYDAFGRRDLDAVLRNLDPQVVWAVAGSRKIWPTAGTYHGPDGVREFWKRQDATFEDYRPEPESLREDGDRVVVPIHVRARRRANLREIERHLLDIWTVADGRVTHVSFHGERGSLDEQP